MSRITKIQKSTVFYSTNVFVEVEASILMIEI